MMPSKDKMARTVLLAALLAMILCRVFATDTSDNLQYPTNNTLEHLLCNASDPLVPGVYTLLPNFNYTIHPGNVCLVENIAQLTIRGTSEENPAQIYCIRDAANFSSRGFTFSRVRSLKIENVRIENCGGLISLPGSNDSHFAVILLNQSSIIHLQNVKIVNYAGYALLGIDVSTSLQLQAVTIHNSSPLENSFLSHSFEADFTEQCVGSGAIFYYTDLMEVNTTLTLTNSSFINNVNCAQNLPVSLSSLIAEDFPIGVSGSGGLTVVLENKTPKITVSVSDCTFQNNSGLTAGAVLLLYLNYPFSGIANFDNCRFLSNSVMESASYQADYRGTDIAAYYKFKPLPQQCNGTAMNCLFIKRSMFNDEQFSDGSPSPHISLLQFTETYGACNVTLSDVQCNHLQSHGCLYALAEGGNEIGHNLNIEMIDISAKPAHYIISSVLTSGLFTLMNLGATIVRSSNIGSSVFENNDRPIFYAYATDLHLSGTMDFRGNKASTSNGAAIVLQANSHLILGEPLQAQFESNSAIYGGAIYSDESASQFCIFQYNTGNFYNIHNIESLNITLTFDNNSATIAGNSIYAQPLYNCYLYSTSHVKISPEDLPQLYAHIFSLPRSTNTTQLAEVSSPAIVVCVSTTDSLPCYTNVSIQIRTYPGKQFSLWMVPLDPNNTPVYAVVTVSYSPKNDVTLSGQDTIQLYGTLSSTTQVNFTVFSTLKYSTGYLSPQLVNLGGSSSPSDESVMIILMDCPPGFERTSGGGCDCNYLLQQKGIICSIDTESVGRPKASWIGIVPDVKQHLDDTGFASRCPSGYCMADVVDVRVSESNILCSGNRSGILCGKCKDGLSTVFGSTGCLRCSNVWVLTILLYAIAGILLVLFLFALRLTVAAGTVNGLIFYANILSINSLHLLEYRGLRWLLVFVSLINLDLGFPICFYNGMNDIVKSYLQYVFPLYLWTIVIVIIFLSRYSSTISRLTSHSSVPVLATLIHLSFSKLLRATVDGLAFTTVSIQKNASTALTQRNVWYFDGSVEYLTGGHVGLFILAVVTLIVFVVPYTVLLSGIRFFAKHRPITHFKPMIDAYTGPYKDQWRFWFGARVCVLVIIFIAYSGLNGDNVTLLLFIESLILVFFTFGQIAVRPFKNSLIGTLDLFFMINCFLLILSAIYTDTIDGPSTLTENLIAGLVVGFAFMVFLGIIIYHLQLVFKFQPPCLKKPGTLEESVMDSTRTPTAYTSSQLSYQQYDKEPESYDPSELREPLIEDADHNAS